MIESIQLLFAPFQTWEKITATRPGWIRVLVLYLLPLLILAVSLESYSLVRWGENRGELEQRVKIPQQTAMRYGMAQFTLLLASMVLGARFLQSVASSFQVPSSFWQCFTLMAYGFNPIILSRFLDAIPGLNTWVCWSLGALISLSVLYHGVALALKPEQTKGFGLYLVSLVVVLFSSGLSHFIALNILHGKLWVS